MYELIQVSDTCYYIQSPARIGLIRLSDHEVCLIDSGNDKDAGKKITTITRITDIGDYKNTIRTLLGNLPLVLR